MDDNENWVLAERKTKEGISLLRIRRLPGKFRFSHYKHRLSITWSYQEESGDGSSTSAEMQFMERFETRVRECIEKNEVALLAIVFTEPSFRQFEYYTPDINHFIKLLNKLPEEEMCYPIEIRQELDGKGEFYSSYSEGFLGQP